MIFFRNKISTFATRFLYMKISLPKEICIWLFVSLIAPVAIPLSFAFLASILVYTDKTFLDTIKFLWIGGTYIFLSLFALVSLLPYFFEKREFYHNGSKTTENIVSVPAAMSYMAIVAIVLLLTYNLFISFLSLIRSEYAVSFSENFWISVIVTAVAMISATLFKFFLVRKKTNSSQRSYNELTNKKITI